DAMPSLDKLRAEFHALPQVSRRDIVARLTQTDRIALIYLGMTLAMGEGLNVVSGTKERGGRPTAANTIAKYSKEAVGRGEPDLEFQARFERDMSALNELEAGKLYRILRRDRELVYLASMVQKKHDLLRDYGAPRKILDGA